MILTRWRPTTSHPGAGAAELSRRIARCGAESVIGERVIHEAWQSQVKKGDLNYGIRF